VIELVDGRGRLGGPDGPGGLHPGRVAFFGLGFAGDGIGTALFLNSTPRIHPSKRSSWALFLARWGGVFAKKRVAHRAFAIPLTLRLDWPCALIWLYFLPPETGFSSSRRGERTIYAKPASIWAGERRPLILQRAGLTVGPCFECGYRKRLLIYRLLNWGAITRGRGDGLMSALSGRGSAAVNAGIHCGGGGQLLAHFTSSDGDISRVTRTKKVQE